MERYGVLYKHHKQERKARWTTYRREQSAMHESCMRVKGQDARKKDKKKKKKVVVAFGAAQFPSTMRGMQPVPRERFLKRLSHHVTVVRTSEMRTSRVCSKGCGWENDPTTSDEWEKKKKDGDLIHMRCERHACGCAGAAIRAVPICPKMQSDMAQGRQCGSQYCIHVPLAAGAQERRSVQYPFALKCRVIWHRSIREVLICPKCRVIWHRDVNAARNIASMFRWQRVHGEKMPPRFSRVAPETPRDDD